ncbi:MAG: hypothetical protein IZT58_02275 [Actinobacteria bacterium]|nr:hypothetical protein [Actinomycetota bacterium]
MTEPPRPTESLTNRHQAVREHLRSVVDSDEFSGSERRRNLLLYLVEETLAGRGDQLKAYNIGLKAIGRPSGFNTQTDPIVRVEIGRLRATLDRYYRAQPHSPIVISIPKGRYTAEFGHPENNETAPEWPRTDGIRILLRQLSANGDAALQISELTTDSLARLLAHLGASVLLSDEQDGRPKPSEGAAGELFEISGSMRTAADRVRCAVTIHRPGARTAIHIAPVEESLVDQHLFDVTDRIAQRVAWILLDDFGVIGRALRATGATRTINQHQDTRDALCETFESPAPATMAAMSETLECLSGTTKRDPRVLAELSDTLFTSWWLGFVQDSETLVRAESLAQEAVRIDPLLAVAHRALAFVHFARRRSELCGIEFEKSFQIATPNPTALASAGLILTLDGQLERGGELTRQAVKLNPLMPSWWHLVPCVEAILAKEADRAYSEAVQISDSGSFAGPAFALAIRAHLGYSGGEPHSQVLLEMHPNFAIEAEQRLHRFIHITEVREYVLAGIRAWASRGDA